jgi:hypothetical protein
MNHHPTQSNSASTSDPAEIPPYVKLVKPDPFDCQCERPITYPEETALLCGCGLVWGLFDDVWVWMGYAI